MATRPIWLRKLRKAVNDYVDESHTKRLAVLPLKEEIPESNEELEGKKTKRRENILGAIIIEQLVDSREPEGMMQRIDVVRKHSATALTNAQEHESLFLMPLWKLLGKTQFLVTARNLPKTLLATAVLAATIFALCTVQYDFTVVADGKLLPEIRRDVFAHLDGMVEEVTVSHGELVKEGQILARQRSPDLEAQIQQLLGNIAETEKDIRSTENRRNMLDSGTSG